MQPLTEKVWQLRPPGGVFAETVVRNLFPEESSGAIKALVHRARVAGEMITLKPGLYCLAPPYCAKPAHPFIIAGLLYGSSYISMETALAYHGAIPEAVFQVASVTAMRSKVFTTPLGRFSFVRVPSSPFKAGVRSESLGDDSWAFVARPWRAIADIVYVRKNIIAGPDALTFLTDSFRIEAEYLRRLPKAELSEVANSIHSRRVVDFFAAVKEQLS